MSDKSKLNRPVWICQYGQWEALCDKEGVLGDPECEYIIEDDYLRMVIRNPLLPFPLMDKSYLTFDCYGHRVALTTEARTFSLEEVVEYFKNIIPV